MHDGKQGSLMGRHESRQSVLFLVILETKVIKF